MVGRKRASKISNGSPKQARRSSGRTAKAEDSSIVSINSSRSIGGVLHYQVQWSNEAKDSWEPAKKVKELAPTILKSFKASEEDDDREYEVEKLLDRRVTSSKADEEGNKIKTTKYLVKWVGYPSSEATWESSESLPKNQIKAFEDEYQGGDNVIISGRKIINNILHYEVKPVGQNKKSWKPIFEIDDIDAIREWEESQYIAGSDNKFNEVKEYQVEKIISKRGAGKRTEYRVSWKGYPTSANSWEPVENLGGAKELIRAFDKDWQEKQDKIASTDYEIEKIVDERVYRGKMCYLVRWRGFKSDQDTWEPEDQFKDAPEALADWEAAKQKKAERAVIAKEKRDAKKKERAEKKAAEKEAAKANGDVSKDAEAKETAESKEDSPARE